MAITTTVVDGPLLDAGGNAIVGEYVYFRLKQAGADNEVSPTPVVVRKPVEGLTDSSGELKAKDGVSDLVLWVNGDSDIQSIYEITTKNKRIEATDVIIPTSAAGTSIALGELLISHVVNGSTDQQSTILADAKAYTDVLADDPTNNASFDATNWRAGLNVEDGATADQTGAEIKALYEAEADTNAFTDADESKLDGIEAGATADQTGAEIKALYEAEADTNAFTDGEKSKLADIEALADVTDTANVTAAGAVMDSELTSETGIKTLTVPDNTTVSAFGATLVDDADSAAARATLITEESVSTVAAMTALTKSTLIDGRVYRALGYHAARDGGGGDFIWDASDTTTANAGTIFASDEGGNGRFLRIFEDPVNVKWFGAKGDDSNNDSAAIIAALDAANSSIFLPDGTYLAHSIPWLQKNIFGDGATIKNNFTGESTFIMQENVDGIQCTNKTVRLRGISNTDDSLHIWDLIDGLMVKNDIRVATLVIENTNGRIITNENDSGAGDTLNMYFNTFSGSTWWSKAANSVANSVQLIAAGNFVSVLRFDISEVRSDASSNFFYFESTSDSPYNQITIENVGSERANAGFATFKGCRNSGVRNAHMFDLNVTNVQTAPLIQLLEGDNSDSEGCFVKGYYRQSTEMSGFDDIYVTSQGFSLHDIGANTAGTVNINGAEGVVVNISDALNISNADRRSCVISTEDGSRLSGLSLPLTTVAASRFIISSGAISVDLRYSSMLVDTEGNASTDDLDTINNGTNGKIIIISPFASRDVVVKHNTGNIRLKDGLDVTLTGSNDSMMLYYNSNSGNWHEIGHNGTSSLEIPPLSATKTITATSYTVLASDNGKTLLVDDDTAGGDVTITLLAAATAGDGFSVKILKKGTTGNVSTTGANVNGSGTQTITGQYDSFEITSDATEYFITEA